MCLCVSGLVLLMLKGDTLLDGNQLKTLNFKGNSWINVILVVRVKINLQEINVGDKNIQV